jgi:hypothetical protein
LTMKWRIGFLVFDGLQGLDLIGRPTPVCV